MPRVGKKMADGEPVSGTKPAAKKPKTKRAPAVRKMPAPLPRGMMLTDFTKKVDWVLGVSIGKGGFGEIYTATRMGAESASDKKEYVIKIEPHENGPLFTELSFYRRIAKPSLISDWKKSHGLSYIAIPEFVAAGDHTHSGVKYRFMVMHRYGEDIEKHFLACQRHFEMKTVCCLALRLLEALEFLHESEYVHADIKGSNLLTGIGGSHQHEVYLVDYGLAYRYRPCGVHKDYVEDPRRKHDGTIEFTSIDAHKGVNPARRGDLEILGYCLLQWACGRLPWEDRLIDKDYVAREKIRYKTDILGLMSACFPDNPPPSCLHEYMKRVYKMEYTEKPDYPRLKDLFQNELKRMSCRDDHKQLDWLTKPSVRKRKPADEDQGSLPKKQQATDAKIAAPPAKVQRSQRPVNKVEPGPVVKTSKKKTTFSSVRKDGRERIPQVVYPHELGYTNGGKKAVRGTKRSVSESSGEEDHLESKVDGGKGQKKAAKKRMVEKPVTANSIDDDEVLASCISRRTRARTKKQSAECTTD